MDAETCKDAEIQRLRDELIAERRRIVEFLASIQGRIDRMTSKLEPVKRK